MALRKDDVRAWAYESGVYDEGWKLGYSQGRQDRKREWVALLLGFLAGRDSKGKSVRPMHRALILGLIIYLVALAIHFLWVILLIALAPRVFRFTVAKIKKDQARKLREQYPREEPF